MSATSGRAKVSKNTRSSTVPVSERQQLALLMQMTSDNPSGEGGGSGGSSSTAVGAPSTVSSVVSGICNHPGSHLGSPSAVAAPSPPAPARRARARNERGETPLHLAAIHNDLAQVRRLLTSGADPNAADFAGWTALHEAANRGWTRVARRLLRAGASVNARGWKGDTPLHDAAANRHLRVARLLLRSGGDATLRNEHGKTPAELAGETFWTEAVASAETGESSDSEDSETGGEGDTAATGSGGGGGGGGGSSVSIDSDGGGSAAGGGAGGGNSGGNGGPRTPAPAPATASRSSSSEMRKGPVQNKANDKTTPTRVTLRLQTGKSRDEKKTGKQADREQKSQVNSNMDNKNSGDDVYEFKSSKEATPVRGASVSPELAGKGGDGALTTDSKNREDSASEAPHTGNKRSAAEITEGNEDGDEENRRKKRKDSDTPGKGSGVGRGVGARGGSGPEKSTKPAAGAKASTGTSGKANSGSDKSADPKNTGASGANSPKPGSGPGSSGGSVKPPDADNDESQSGKSGSESGLPNVGPKVPPLKIVIPQQSVSLEPEQGTRNGKNGASRHHQALPYVVASSNSNDSVTDKDGAGSGSISPTDNGEKKDMNLTDDQRMALHHQRVLRSSHRSGSSGPNPSGSRSSSPTAGSAGPDDSSPQEANHESPSPVESSCPASASDAASIPSASTSTTTAAASNPPSDEKHSTTESTSATAVSTTTSTTLTPAPMELHPRKRKLKPHRETATSTGASTHTSSNENTETSNASSEVHPHDQPITNCYQLFLNIRKQIERRRKGLFPVQPKPPQGFKDYLMNRCTYALASTANRKIGQPPATLTGPLRDLYVEQEKERHKLKMQHIIEKEKLVLSVEQEILRVHGRAARALANQALPFSACSILKDEEVYNVITPEQEEKDRNARSRYNGRLFLSWLQDVDDKWEKIKESMLLRHHHEAESLYAVQRMDWKWKLKELNSTECVTVPFVHVSDDFDLLPA